MRQYTEGYRLADFSNSGMPNSPCFPGITHCGSCRFAPVGADHPRKIFFQRGVGAAEWKGGDWEPLGLRRRGGGAGGALWAGSGWRS